MITATKPVRTSWMKGRFENCKRDDAFYLLVNNRKIRDCPEFSLIWRINSPVAALSTRRGQQKRGCMNQQYFKGAYREILKREWLDETIQI
jgi:hypothetical protein